MLSKHLQLMEREFEKLFTAELLQKNPAASYSEFRTFLLSQIRTAVEESFKATEVENRKVGLLLGLSRHEKQLEVNGFNSALDEIKIKQQDYLK